MRFGIWEIVLILILVLLLFGAAKFPAMMKNLASGVKEFKKEIKDDSVKKGDKKPTKAGKK